MIFIDVRRRRAIGTWQIGLMGSVLGALLLLAAMESVELEVRHRVAMGAGAVLLLLSPLLLGRVTTWNDSHVTVRTLFTRAVFAIRRSAIGVRVTGGRSPDVELRIESDDGRVAKLAVWMAFGMAAPERAAETLRQAIQTPTNSRVHASLAEEKANRDRAMAHVAEYYRSPAWRGMRLVFLLVVGLALAASAAMVVLQALTGG